MFLSIGIESPKHDDEAYGIAVPALCIGDYGCFGAADESANIAECAQDAIDGILLAMAADEFDIDGIVDLGALEYQKNEDYAHCDSWLMLDVDLSEYSSQAKRINVSLPSALIKVIDNAVKSKGSQYKDRSDFLATAARSELRG